MILGTIVKGIGGFYYVDTGDNQYECKARGLFRLKNIKPIVGDLVEIEVDEKTKQGFIVSIKKRKTEMNRPEVANVEQVVIIIAAKNPDIDIRLLQKLLVYAEFVGLEIIVCINKIDLDLNKEYMQVIEMLNTIPYNVIKTSALLNIGIEDLANFLSGKISVVAGPSGAGKSSILNAINSDLNLKTGKISNKSKRGTHTTRHTELIKLSSGGMVVDTPGFTSFNLLEIDEKQLQNFYPEFNEYKDCKYPSCVHDKEPNCGIKNAVKSGLIHELRYNDYILTLNELRERRKY